jgi:RNA polymerase sigma-70 factor (ECF subfamily)
VGAFRKELAGDTFRGWLRRITQNKLHDHFRRAAREVGGAGGSSAREQLARLPGPEPTEPDSKTDDEGERILFGRALDLIRSEFAEQTWAAFWGVVVDGRSAIDVAADFGMTPGAVRVAKCRVVRRLREELSDGV